MVAITIFVSLVMCLWVENYLTLVNAQHVKYGLNVSWSATLLSSRFTSHTHILNGVEGAATGANVINK